MRDYSKVSAQFWVGKTGRAMRGDMQTQVVAMYLMTSPHANMIGVYHCPIVYIAHETGSPIEGATKGLKRLCDDGFCTYDDDNEMVWVHEMAKFQIGDELKPGDKQIKGLQKQFEALPESHVKQGFYEKYKKACQEEDHALVRGQINKRSGRSDASKFGIRLRKAVVSRFSGNNVSADQDILELDASSLLIWRHFDFTWLAFVDRRVLT